VTAVARLLVVDAPALVGDVVLTRDGKRLDDGGGKIYVIAPNVALGWAGEAQLAIPALRYLTYVLGGRVASLKDLERIFERLDDLRRQGGMGLDLTGWVMTPNGPKGIRWTSDARGPLFDEGDGHAIGSGGPELLGWLVPPPISRRNTVGYDVAPMKVISGLMIPRCEEMARPDWPQSWGKAYDAILWQEGAFRWLDKLTYIRWRVVLDNQRRISKVEQATMVFTQERLRHCTLMRTKSIGDIRVTTELSTPIHRGQMDLDWYFNQPYSAVSPYYANYFVVDSPADQAYLTLAFVAKHATPNGLMHHVGTDPTEPRFEVNAEELEKQVRWMLEESRRKGGTSPPPGV
jgi:hypothetical protein